VAGRVSSIVLFLFLACAVAQAETPGPAGPFLGQAPPGFDAKLFAPGIVNLGLYTRDIAMTPDGREVYFSIVVGQNKLAAIAGTRLVDGRWTAPEVLPQLGVPGTSSIEPCISPDGKRFYFSPTARHPARRRTRTTTTSTSWSGRAKAGASRSTSASR
jgi:hypothetical protein